MKYTYDQCDTFHYRRSRMRGNVEELWATLMGRRITVRELLSDKNGKLSEKKMQKLINDLISSWRVYSELFFMEDSIMYYDNEGDALVPESNIPKGKESCYRAYLYCVLTFLYYSDLDFEDLVQISRDNIVYENYETLLHDFFLRDVDIALGSFLMPYESMDYLQGFNYRLVVSDSPEKLEDNYLKSIEADKKDAKTLTKSLTPEDKETIESTRDDILLQLRGEPFYEEEHEEKRKGFLKTVSNHKKYREHFKEYLRLQHHRGKSDSFAKNIENMVDLYLFGAGLSLITDKHAFYKSYARIRKENEAVKKASALGGRSGKNE